MIDSFLLDSHDEGVKSGPIDESSNNELLIFLYLIDFKLEQSLVTRKSKNKSNTIIFSNQDSISCGAIR